VGFEPTIPGSERAKTTGSATVTGEIYIYVKLFALINDLLQDKRRINATSSLEETRLLFYIYALHSECIIRIAYVWCVDRHCGLVVTVPGYTSRGPGFDSRRYQIL
jgi:hypothetical protein